MSALIESNFLKFPLQVENNGPRYSTRSEHVREQIEQLLFTSPKERVFRPEFGVGVRRLIFEPNNLALWNITRKRLTTSLAESLHGEVDPKTLTVDVSSENEKLIIHISYTLAAIRKQERHSFSVGSGGGNG